MADSMIITLVEIDLKIITKNLTILYRFIK